MLEGFKKMQILIGSSFLSITSNGLNFNGNVVIHMQEAKNVILLINETTKQLAIQKCDEQTEDKITFCRNKSNRTNGVRFNNREIQQTIAKMMNWNLEQYNYRADGFYLDEDEAMIFNLNKARRFPKRSKRNTKTETYNLTNEML